MQQSNTKHDSRNEADGQLYSAVGQLNERRNRSPRKRSDRNNGAIENQLHIHKGHRKIAEHRRFSNPKKRRSVWENEYRRSSDSPWKALKSPSKTSGVYGKPGNPKTRVGSSRPLSTQPKPGFGRCISKEHSTILLQGIEGLHSVVDGSIRSGSANNIDSFEITSVA